MRDDARIAEGIVNALTELFRLSYLHGKSITISPPPVGDWVVVIDQQVFTDPNLLEAVEAGVKYLDAEVEHERDVRGEQLYRQDAKP